ncbi:MAG: PilN domain-containing protein [Quisquiliibacterium sp.]
MIRINLLPHRLIRRERRKKAFVFISTMTAAAGAAVALIIAFVIQSMIDAQQARNDFISAENRKLDAQIKEIAALRQEIEALRARQEAVETLQRDRTLPVHLFDELVVLMPEGVQLQQVRQVNRRVGLTGFAQSNERVSALLFNLANQSAWLERPELKEIKAVMIRRQEPGGAASKGKGASAERRAYQFQLNVAIKDKGATEQAATRAPGAAAAGKKG